MAIRHLVWACVACGAEGTLEARKKTEVCRECGATYARERGASIRLIVPGHPTRVLSPAQLVPMLPPIAPTGSARCEVREWVRDEPLRLFGRYLGRYEILGDPRSGTIILDADRIAFTADQGPGFTVPLLDITGIQPSSNTLQLKARNRSVFSVRFDGSSPKLWEERLQAAVNAASIRSGAGEVVEYQPRVATLKRSVAGNAALRVRRRIRAARGLSPERPWQYRLACWIARNGWRIFGGGVTVEGLENIPPKGPFLVLANHESYLETMLVPAVMPRAVHMMAKSTQFGSRLTGWLMARLFAYPVRRFEIDPQAVRYTVKRMSEGYGIAIFIEGERTWDGSLQAARLGTVRLALNADVPVIPCLVRGAYDAWPRWSSKPQRNRITVSFGRPLDLSPAQSRLDCETGLTTAVQRIRTAISPATLP